MQDHDTPTAGQVFGLRLDAEADLCSLGYLSASLQRHPRELLAVAAHLRLKPLAIDGVPFWSGPQAARMADFFREHRVKVSGDVVVETAPVVQESPE